MNHGRRIFPLAGVAAFFLAALVALVALATTSARAADWPMWRFDAYRSAASPEVLAPQLFRQWTRQYAPRVQVWDDPLNHDLMPYDKAFEPVVLGARMFVGFNDTDKVVALDLRSGAELWAFYTDGPVRFPPVAWQEKIYFTSDDGYLYCVSAGDGKLLWKFRGGPSDRKVLGNQRVISAWPARGGPVLRDGRVYFAASIWPFMGTFIYALDAASGKVGWVNDGTGAQFIRQPHSAPSFGGVAPQGALVATQEILLVPGGRSVPAAFNRQTGEFIHFQHSNGGKGNGGSFVAATDTEYFLHTRGHGTRAFELKTGNPIKLTNSEPVLDGTVWYSAATNKTGRIIQAIGADKKVQWEVKADASVDLIKAGKRLYAAGSNSVSAIELPAGLRRARVVWNAPVRNVQRLLAANGKLIATTLEGRIVTFGDEKIKAVTLPAKPRPVRPAAALVAQAKALLAEADASEGYALWFGVEDGQLLEAVLLHSKLRIVAVDPDAEKVEQLRRRWDAAGFYGARVTLHTGDPVSFQAPPYLANLIVVGESQLAHLQTGAVLRMVYESLRPFGGALWLPAAGAAQTKLTSFINAKGLEQAQVREAEGHLLVRRVGALPESANWTHQYGDIGNTLKSDDARVKAPLGLLWFGGTSNLDVLPRHGHGPPEQVIGGRMFIQGMNSLSARDVYTGRLLWKTEFPSLGTFGIYYDSSYTNTPLSTAYNQKHIPGANGRGANYIATEDAVYLVVTNTCQVLDARTGTLTRTLTLPPRPGTNAPVDWAFIGIYENVLLAGDGFARHSVKFGGASKPSGIEDFSASGGLVAFDRHSGAVLWRVEARHSFLHNGIVAGNGRVYCLDKLPLSAEDKLKRRGAPIPQNYRLAAFDAQTGAPLWETGQNIFGTWLGYSKLHDVLLLAGAKATDRLKDEVGEGLTAYRGLDGEVRWQDLKRKYVGPVMLHNELILTSANSYQSSSGAFNLHDGTPHLVRNPLTGKSEPWRISRAYGCNNIVASEHLLTFRSGAAGFYDLISKSGTGNLGGFKSGCTANLVVANGVLNAPDYTRTCTCAYQNQTSLALIHMPDLELWTYSQFGLDGESGDRIERVGINFGAPGDRRAADGTLWLEYPSVGGDSPGLPISVSGKGVAYFRRHASQVTGAGLSWVMASGVREVETITVTPELVRPTVSKPPRSKDDEEDEAVERAKFSGSFIGPQLPTALASASAAAPKPEIPPLKPLVMRPPHPAAPYTVRLFFAEPEDLQPGQRVFSIALQGRSVLEKFDIALAAGGHHRGVVKEFNGIIIQKDLKLTLTRAPGARNGPILCGLELIAERRTAGK